jgi:hypothetical protein
MLKIVFCGGLHIPCEVAKADDRRRKDGKVWQTHLPKPKNCASLRQRSEQTEKLWGHHCVKMIRILKCIDRIIKMYYVDNCTFSLASEE